MAGAGEKLKPGHPAGPSKSLGDEDEVGRLVARAGSGDAAAFEALVERFKDRAYGLALRILRSPADAEEVAQDAFVRAWLALPRYRGEARFSTWLYRIVARRSFDRAAVLRTRRAHEAAGEAAGGDPSAPPAHASAEQRERARRMERLVAALPDAQRAVVTMFYYEDGSVEQVARALEMPEGTVKTHLGRVRAALRAAWLKQEGRVGIDDLR